MIKRLISGIFMVCLCLRPGLSQKNNYETGYLVTNKNDTLYGSFKNQNDIKSKIMFRQGGEDNFQTWSPEDILCFSFGSGSYKSFKIPIDSLSSEMIFMKVLVKGYMTLYYLKNEFFVIEKEQETYIMDKKEDKIKIVRDQGGQGDRTIVIPDTRYIGLLMTLVSDCPGLKEKFENLTFSPSEISRIVRKYNYLKAPEAETGEPQNTNNRYVEFGFKIDYFINDMTNYIRTGRYYNINFTKEPCFSGGMIVDFNLNKKLSLQTEALLTQRKSSVYSENPYGEPEDITWNMVFFEMPVSLYYTFPGQKIKPHLFAGGVVGMKVSDKSEIQTIHESFIGKMDKVEFGYQFGTGINFKSFGNTRLRLEYYYGITHTNIYSWTMKYRHYSNNFSASILF